MAKIIISCEGQPIREVELGTDRMTIGRHPHNDIVLSHPTVSSRHASITLLGDHALLEDLGSTNGTFVNGKRIERHKLSDRGHAILAACHLDFVAGLTAPAAAAHPAPAAAPAAPVPPAAPNQPVSTPHEVPAPTASIEVRSGANAGRKLNLTKPLTTLGSPGVLVVVIARVGSGYTLTHVEGGTLPIVNGKQAGRDPHPLANGDLIDLAGTTMSFSVAS
ncbi:FHA domain-containing protein [Pseudoduganella sp. GCM10020061]|uniref:FHA domain-containing protein n=1 Tax=Pseudoduganella sp. GCM10020061 TaxID=3317345 RepID=UPI0036270B3C